MSGTIRGLALAGVSAAVLTTAGIATAHAGAFGLREASSQAQGMSFAGAAAGSGGVSSMFWNPAVVTMRPGWVSEQNLAVIIPQATIRSNAATNPAFNALGDSGDIGQAAVVPSGATSYQLSDRLWVGISTGAPYGLVTKPRAVWAGEVYARSSKIFSLSINPVLGFKVTDWLSVAVGPNIEYFRLKLKQADPRSALFPANYGTTILKGDEWGVGVTAGALITPTAGTTFGVGYRSSVHHDIDGNIVGPTAALSVPGRVSAKLNTPEKVSVGLTQAINPVTRVNFGFEWDNWSRLKNINVISNLFGVPVTSLPLNYKDGYTYSIGAEYDYSPQWTFRTGVSYEFSPIDFTNRSARLPDNDRVAASIGASYRYSEKLTLNVAYSHLFVGDSRVLAGAGRDYNVGNIAFGGDVVDSSVDIVSVGFRYVFGDVVVAQPAPLIRKY